jgi:uncharacterized protein (TIGR03435 family)
MAISRLIAFLIFVSPLAAQVPTVSTVFEVASIKPSRPDSGGVSGGCHGIDSVYTPGERIPPLGRCEITSARLSHLVSTAWGIETMSMIHSGPDWIQRGDERFDVMARADDPAKTTEKQLLAMLQAMLVERFQMKFHREAVDSPGFALTVDKNGPKLQASKSQDGEMTFGKNKAKPVANQPVHLKARHFSIEMLVQFLSTFGGKGYGVDKTGLPGFYDFTLDWDDDAGPTLPVALREQLGLKMEQEKVAVSNFIIDSAQRPSEN